MNVNTSTYNSNNITFSEVKKKKNTCFDSCRPDII